MTALDRTAPVLIHIVSYNSERWIRSCLEGALTQDGFSPGVDLFVRVTDNASTDNTAQYLNQYKDKPGVSIDLLSENIGFCGGHNRGAKSFLEGDYPWFLILNPDLRLAPGALLHLRDTLVQTKAKSGCPLLLRADEDLKPLEPPLVDSAGMVLHPNVRHFDRGADQPLKNRYQHDEFVFGGSGACLMLHRSFVESMLLVGEEYEKDLYLVHPELERDKDNRVPFFDEAFFAYREDAELAWRANRYGFRCLFVAGARGYHVRRVTPERRSQLPSSINALGVRNRFLLQWTHLRIQEVGLSVFLLGWFRNLIVILGVLVKEPGSLRGIREAWTLRRRAKERGDLVKKAGKKVRTEGAPSIRTWFWNAG